MPTRNSLRNSPMRPASIEAVMAKLSNCDEVACKGGIVAYITTTNGGSYMRYYGFEDLGGDFVAALVAEDAAAIPVADMPALDVLKNQIRQIVDDSQSILTARIRAFQFGAKILDFEY